MARAVSMVLLLNLKQRHLLVVGFATGVRHAFYGDPANLIYAGFKK